MDPMTIMAIAAGAKAILGGISGKKKATQQQDLEAQQYQDQGQTYYAEHAAAEQKRMQKARLIEAFAKANGIDGALKTMMPELLKERAAVAPPPYRKGGTPGFGWDMASTIASAAANIWGASKGAGGGLGSLGSSLKPKPVSLGVGSGFGGTATANPFMRSTFTTPYNFD